MRAVELGFQLVRVLSQQGQDKLGRWLRMGQLPQCRFDERGPASLRAREAEWELGTFATDKYRSSLTTSRNHYAA